MVALVVNLIASFRTALRCVCPSILINSQDSTGQQQSASISSTNSSAQSSSLVPPPTSTPKQIKPPFGIPLPPILHVTLDDQLISRFDEIFVIGDVHGCYDEMRQLIDIADVNVDGNKNSKKILKIFVGDLVNKGPKSQEVIQFMINNIKKDDNCLSVRGNHDEMVIREYIHWEKHGSFNREKNEWISNLTREQIDYLISMPYTISIPTLDAIIVHAGLVPHIELESQSIDNMTRMRNVYESEGVYYASEKSSEGQAWATKWSGPHVYFGHDAKRLLQKEKCATGLDTGCVYGRALTACSIMGPRLGQFISVTPKMVYEKPKG